MTPADTLPRALRRHLVTSGLCGSVATSPGNSIGNCGRLAAGDPEYTFGLSDWATATAEDARAALRAVCGGPREGAAGEGRGWIDPVCTEAGIVRHRDVLAAFVRAGGGRVLLATGHPTGLLAHYGAVARALQAAGCDLLCPLDDVELWREDGRSRIVRYLDAVACISDGGALLHTHRSRAMEAVLDELGGGPGTVDLAIADHGWAGACIERGIPTLSIADVNDPALPLAQVRGRTDGVLPIDDNLAPRLFVPVTDAILDWDAAP